MKCVYCSFSDTKVADKRDSSDLNTIKRRRECLKCGKRFTTFERVEQLQLVIEKKDGTKEPFDRAKLVIGVGKACEKRLPEQKIGLIVDKIEAKIRRLKSTTVSSSVLGQEVLRRLKAADEVAYLRFASVYKDFHDLDSFKEELQMLKKR